MGKLFGLSLGVCLLSAGFLLAQGPPVLVEEPAPAKAEEGLAGELALAADEAAGAGQLVEGRAEEILQGGGHGGYNVHEGAPC
jgi:hypothetical protein